MPGEYLTLQEAADELDVHYMTVYRYVRLGQLPAHKAGSSWRVAHADLRWFQQEKASDSSHAVSRGNVDWSSRLEARLVDGDQTGAWRVVEAALSSGMEPLGVYTTMMVPALGSIGHKWASGEVSVAEEHVASVVAGRLIGRLGPRFTRRGRTRGRAVVVAPSGERHALGPAMVSDALRATGFAVVDLGVDTPVDSFRSVIASTTGIKGVAIGAATSGSLGGAAEMADVAREVLGGDVPVVVGGGGVVDDAHARRLGGDATAQVGDVAAVIGGGPHRPGGVVGY